MAKKKFDQKRLKRNSQTMENKLAKNFHKMENEKKI